MSLYDINDTESKSSPLLPNDAVAIAIKELTMDFFLALVVLLVGIIIIALLMNKKIHFMPEALAVMILGIFIALIINYIAPKLGTNVTKWKDLASFHPEVFFLILLPPIIFESGYTLQKGDFFSNIGAVLTYAVLGTIVSALIIGFSMYGLGHIGWVHKLNIVEAFAFGSLISATDPVSTLALFSAINADQDLYAIVFGESVLNDAVSIILTLTIMSASKQMSSEDFNFRNLAAYSIGKFCIMFFLSAIIGVMFGLASALLVKFVRMTNHPSLECVTVIIFAFMPYGFCEGINLSGIMAILLCGITMSHYTHFSLSPISQIAIQHIFRIAALIAETIVFLFLGMAVLNDMDMVFDIKFISWSLFACIISRAVVVFPLSLFFIHCRSKENRISLKILVLIWFSGLRGAVAYAQSLHLPLRNFRAKKLLETTTLAIVFVTNMVLGLTTLPLVKLLKVQQKQSEASFSKSSKLGKIVSPLEASTQRVSYKTRLKKSPISIIRGWRRFDKKYLMPFFIRINKSQDYASSMTQMVHKWAKNEEQTVGRLLASTEMSERSPLIAKRMHQNLLDPVRQVLCSMDEVQNLSH